ncbi:MAG: methylmalonyl Co-A mutase-associated GTPase MeaB [Anaerolineae bacterium]|nr:methylmalonyl Co-A mutase-associated GTPase MeaB [Anaerolineae bacterium]
MNIEQHIDLIQSVLENHKRALARAISLIEASASFANAPAPTAADLLTALYPHTGQAHLVGITGAPGTGKSTLVNQLARAYRRQDVRVGILAVDPTSPFTGGALLGDRIRMQDLAGDPGVFIRSMATRGAPGGLSAATFDAALILDAAGYGVILIETVGAGQDEVEIARLADTVVVVDAPGLGDDVQAGKAGLMEIADIFVVNKADRPGADQAVRALELMLEMDTRQAGWPPPVCKTVSIEGTGVEQIISHIYAHRQYLISHHFRESKERQRAEHWLIQNLHYTLTERFLANLEPGQWQDMIIQIATRQIDPYSALHKIMKF